MFYKLALPIGSWYKPQLTQEDHILSGGRVSDVVGNLIERNKKIQRSKDLL